MSNEHTMTAGVRRTLLASASIAAVLGLSACGGGSAEAYCSTLEESVEGMSGMDLDDPQAFMTEGMDELAAMLDNAASDAPDEIADEHATVQEVFEEISALDLEAMMDVEALMQMDEDEVAEVEAEIAALEERFENVDEDGERWGEWVEENCEIEDPLS